MEQTNKLLSFPILLIWREEAEQGCCVCASKGGEEGMGASSETATTLQQRKCLAENKHWQPSSSSCSSPPSPSLSPSTSSLSSSSSNILLQLFPMSSSHLEDFLVQTRLLREHLELPGVRVLVDLEVAFHDPQLVVFERGPCTLRLCLTHPVGFHARGVALKNQ